MATGITCPAARPVWPLTKRVAGPHRMRPRAGPHARTLGTLAWVPITQLTGFCVLTDIGAAKGEGHGKSGRRGPLTAPCGLEMESQSDVGVEVSPGRVLIKISPLVHLRHILQRRVRVRSGSTLVELESSLSSHEPYRRVTRSVRADVFPHFRSSARAPRTPLCRAVVHTRRRAHANTRT